MTKKNIINVKSIILAISLASIAIAITIIIGLGISIDIFKAKLEAGKKPAAVAVNQLDKLNLNNLKVSKQDVGASELKPVAHTLAVKSLNKNLLALDLDKNKQLLSLQTLKTAKSLPLKELDKHQHSLDLAVLPSLVKLQLNLRDLG
jgi:hypothetical protein